LIFVFAIHVPYHTFSTCVNLFFLDKNFQST